jgi:DNA-binding CsgD family transcriptional regulator
LFDYLVKKAKKRRISLMWRKPGTSDSEDGHTQKLSSHNTEFLRRSFGLTPAEADITLALFSGETRVSIAERRSVARDTLRGQIKAIYAKTGVSSEAALMRLLASIDVPVGQDSG